MEKTKGQQLQDELTFKFPHIAKEAPSQREEAELFCEGYKRFLDNGKTERECVREAAAMLEMQGYRPFEEGKSYKAGDKVYFVNRGKSIIATTFGKAGLEQGVRINSAHIDSPRLDLKPNPVYEKNDLAYFKTHYYGGIHKYQWGTVPLAIHGVVVKKNGEIVEVNIGEKEGDPVFCVTDLLPHLSGEHNERKLRDGLKGEELNVLIGSIPFIDEAELKDPVKLLALKLLNERYGITEADFFRAEIEMVPAQKACDVGLDRSMIGAYGQDDRVCAYTALMAEIDASMPEYTTVTVLADKEEVGSGGNTGLDSDFVLHYIEDLAAMARVDVRKVLRNSICLSSDVNAAYDPTFAQVYEERNSCFLNKGCVLTKYTGVRGKSGSNDASAELMAKIIAMMEQEGVYWQIGELGAVDQGGGGTIAKYVAHMDVDVVDLGVPILSMHSPFELSAKLDVYNTYKAFRGFYK
ncbi:aminopeptidase [Lacrimispora brassicae]